MKSVLVIGAGIGGISTAARLARRGYNVTVIEKNEQAGGRCGRMEVDGHRFEWLLDYSSVSGYSFIT